MQIIVDDREHDLMNSFTELLKTEKSKYQGKLDRITFVKDNLEHTLTSTEVVIDSLNTTIDNRSKELNRIKRKYAQQLSNIDGMSHNELTNFFTEIYGN